MNEIRLLVGLPGSGKSKYSLLKHLDVDGVVELDKFVTRKKEKEALDEALRLGQSIIVDNTNLTVEKRRRYFKLCPETYKITAYYFYPQIKESFKRMTGRKKNKFTRGELEKKLYELEIPKYSEGFEEIYLVEGEKITFIPN